MRRTGIAVYGIAIAALTLLTVRGVLGFASYLFDTHTTGSIVIAAIGMCVATIGPLLLSALCWMVARRSALGWSVHLLGLLAFVAVFRVGESMFYFAVGVPDGDSIEGYMMMPALWVLAVLLVVHGVTFAKHGISARGCRGRR